MKKIIICLLLLTVVGQTAFAAEYKELEKLNLPTQSVNPGDFYYSAKRLWEKVLEKSQFGKSAKYKYANSQIYKRMSELSFVVRNERLDEIQRSSERLAYYIGALADYLIEEEEKDNMNQLKTKIDSFLPGLAELRDSYPANSSFWMLVQHDINTINEFSEKLSK